MPVEVVRLPHDYWFELPGDDGRKTWEPYTPGEDGFYYYVRANGGDFLGSPRFNGLEDARGWANAQPWAPIECDVTPVSHPVVTRVRR